jgi:hypothetical protein
MPIGKWKFENGKLKLEKREERTDRGAGSRLGKLGRSGLRPYKGGDMRRAS